MENKSSKLLTLIVALLVIVSCNKKQVAPQAQHAPSFTVAVLQPKTVTGNLQYQANIEGIVNNDVRAKASGYIEKVYVDEGQKVHKGQLLFKLETQVLSQDANAAKARVEVAKVEVSKLEPLVAKNIISEVQLATAKANLGQAVANYNSVVANIDYANVRSAIDGYVGTINFREGSLVSPSDKTPLTTVSDVKEIYAFFSMNEADYLDFIQQTKGKTREEKIANFPKASLILANGETFAETGKIQTTSGQVNPNTGTVSFRAIFKNPMQLLSNGNSAVISIPKQYENAVVIPQAATFEQQGKIIAYKLDANNKVISTPITVSTTIGSLYVVASGLAQNDKIVTAGVGKLKGDMAITPIETPFDSIIKPIETLFKY